jgi:hypothetical protein
MFSTQDIERLRGQNTLESFCAIVQKHCTIILWCCESFLYTTRNAQVFLDSVEKVELMDDQTFPEVWQFCILFKHGEGASEPQKSVPDKWDEVYIFDSLLANELKMKCSSFSV